MSVHSAPARRGTNLPRVGDFNESVVLEAIRRSANGMSRVELARATGLSAQTVSNICRRLLDRGLVEETGKQSTGAGKPRTILTINPVSRFAIGVHLDPAVVTYVVLDLEGRVVEGLRRPTPEVVDPDQTMAEIGESVGTLVERAGVEQDRILGLGIAAPGPIDAAAGLVVDPPQLAGWVRVPLRDHLADATGLPVILDKDVTAAAIAERWAGAAANTGNFLFFYLGTGSGMGIVVENSIVRGASANAGEVGGLDANCTTRALVEEAVATGVLDASHTTTSPHASEQSLQVLTGLAEQGHVGATAILDGWAGRVARGVAAAATLLDSDLVVFGGPIWPQLSSWFLPIATDVINRSPFVEKMHPTTVTETALGADVGAIGAACLVLDRTLSPQPESLMFS
ncbi:ROK family transcriptional regulator [Jiangella alkaliphila]|uniref:Sugar kinase of the NBD/HSP70 family, may contain an N-terminal HTH domain n=1 Tax=Jiangella alkaliphila TaxID=419479 RepID=A0A1H2LGJ2_9ACTN|nr:ROK family transcriptional regulator [Jiangella alkaliphila]SDU79701.1 Sugar kinase of the NBD/HSP70 family, may contain an N-terminal HTH domain [Jiangella alkaliphila]